MWWESQELHDDHGLHVLFPLPFPLPSSSKRAAESSLRTKWYFSSSKLPSSSTNLIALLPTSLLFLPNSLINAPEDVLVHSTCTRLKKTYLQLYPWSLSVIYRCLAPERGPPSPNSMTRHASRLFPCLLAPSEARNWVIGHHHSTCLFSERKSPGGGWVGNPGDAPKPGMRSRCRIVHLSTYRVHFPPPCNHPHLRNPPVAVPTRLESSYLKS